MQPTTRADLVDRLCTAILERLRDGFPRAVRLDTDALARSCRVAVIDDGAAVSSYEPVAGKDFYTLVLACRTYLGDEGYLRGPGGHWTVVSLTERGATLTRCLPAVIASGRG